MRAAFLAVGLVLTILIGLLGHDASLIYDKLYALIWGRDLADGRLPDYSVYAAPTPHPLAITVGAVLAPLGEAADDVYRWIGNATAAALILGAFRLTDVLFGRLAGVGAALLLGTSTVIFEFGVTGYDDVTFAALVVWAGAIEAQHPRRGAPVFLLLGLAGLLRPEGWLFAAAYVVWMLIADRTPRAAAKWAAMAAAAPVLWCLSDLIVTGDPLWSLHGTLDLAEELNRDTGGARAAEFFPRFLNMLLGPLTLLLAAAAVVVGVRRHPGRFAIPLAVLMLNGLAFLAIGLNGLPLNARYILPAVAMTCVVAAGAVSPRMPWPRAAQVMAATAVTIAVALALPDLENAREHQLAIGNSADQLVTVLNDPATAAALRRCDRMYLPDFGTAAVVAWETELPTSRLEARRRPGADAVVLAPGETWSVNARGRCAKR